MAKNKKAQILAAVMCAATVAGVSPAISSAAQVNGADGDIKNPLTITVGNNTVSVQANNTSIGKFVFFADGAFQNSNRSFYVTANGDVTAQNFATNDYDLNTIGANLDEYVAAGIVAGEVGQYTAGTGTMAIGENSQANGVYSVAIGNSSKANGTNSVAVGRNATVNEGINYGVALGAYSVATEEKTVSVGRADIQRRIVNVADGINANDAATYGQVQPLEQKTQGITRTEKNGYVVTEVEGAKFYDNGGFATKDRKFVVDKDGNVTAQGNVKTAEGADLNDMNDTLNGYENVGIVAGTVKDSANNSIALGEYSYVGSNQSVAFGANSMINDTADYSVALGDGTRVYASNAVALGYNSVANRDNTVSVGDVNNERQITNVAAGTEDTDAVNVKQLKDAQASVDEAFNEYADAGIIAGTVKDGINNSIALGEGSYVASDQSVALGEYSLITEAASQSIALGTATKVYASNAVALGYNSVADRANTVSIGSEGNERQITNVAAGTEDTDAVNVKQLKDVQAGVDETFNEYADAGIIAGTVKDGANNSIALGEGSYVGANQSVAFGENVIINDTSDYSVALGDGTRVYASNAVALGYNSVADRANTVSVGSVGNERQITNVAAGTANTDAVNVAQLNEVKDSVATTNKDVNDIKQQVGGISRVENEDGGYTTVINEDTSINGDLNVSGKFTVGGKEIATSEEVDGLTGRVENVETDVKGIKEDIGDVNAIDGEIKGDNIVSSINNEVNTRRSEISRIDNDIKHLDNRVGSLEDRMGDVEDRIDKVGAMAAAIANLRTMGYDPEAPTEIAVGVGQYESETGLALGVFHYPNQDFMLSASISTSGDEVMGGIGATWKIGRKSSAEKARSVEEKRVAKAEEMQEMAKAEKVKAQRERHAQMLAEREAAK